MSTREFILHNNALNEYVSCYSQLKCARTQFINRVRKTGTKMRKELIRAPNKISAINCTLKNPRAVRVAMTVRVYSNDVLDNREVTLVRDWLTANGWEVTWQGKADRTHLFTCI